MTGEARSTRWGWFRIVIVCGATTVALALLAAGIVTLLTFRGYERALAVREELDRRFGNHENYRVPGDGAIPADRLARFLAVRRSLLPRCPEVTEVTRSFARVDAMAEQDRPDVPELFRRVGEAARRVPTIGLVFGAYVTDRNRALLEAGTGLGEYTWIYVVGYFALLRQEPVRLFREPDRADVLRGRVYPEVARVIARHVADAGLTSGPWVDESARLRAEPTRVPFSDGLPPELATSLAPAHAALETTACPAAAELDLTLTVRRGSFGYDHK